MKNIKLKESSNNNLNGLALNIKKINTIIVDVYTEIKQMQEIYRETGSKVYGDLKLILQISDKIIFIDKITLIYE
jgi:hypothetical protein